MPCADTALSNFASDLRVAVIGATGGIGSEFVRQLSISPNVAQVLAFAHTHTVDEHFSHPKVSAFTLDICSEAQIQQQFSTLQKTLDIVIVASGLLHNEACTPEKSIRSLSMQNFEQVFRVNTFGPALVAKHALPCLKSDRKSIFAVLSARVGSINDNRLGGWYSYRASKAALNMLIKTLAIETTRQNKHACIIGLHPGTVDTPLSRPYQASTPPERLFTPGQAVTHLLQVINQTTLEHSGEVLSWDGQRVPP